MRVKIDNVREGRNNKESILTSTFKNEHRDVCIGIVHIVLKQKLLHCNHFNKFPYTQHLIILIL